MLDMQEYIDRFGEFDGRLVFSLSQPITETLRTYKQRSRVNKTVRQMSLETGVPEGTLKATLTRCDVPRKHTDILRAWITHEIVQEVFVLNKRKVK
jgi:hypothetical protein